MCDRLQEKVYDDNDELKHNKKWDTAQDILKKSGCFDENQNLSNCME